MKTPRKEKRDERFGLVSVGGVRSNANARVTAYTIKEETKSKRIWISGRSITTQVEVLYYHDENG